MTHAPRANGPTSSRPPLQGTPFPAQSARSPKHGERWTAPGDERHRALLEACDAFNEDDLCLDMILDITSHLLTAFTGDAGVVALVADDGRRVVPYSASHNDARRQPAFRAAALIVHASVPATLEPLPAPMIHLLPVNAGDEESLRGVVMPLHIGGAPIGTITSYRSARNLPHDAEDIDLLRALADHAAPVINNAQLHRQLADRDKRLATIIDQLMQVQEADRRRVAYDIHDGLAQIAASTYQHLEAFASHHTCGPDELADLERTQELARRTIHEARRVIAELRPTALDDFGLSAALRDEIRELRKEGIAVDFTDTTAGHRWPRAHEAAIFRTAQEALTNIRKHAGPTPVRISLGPRGSGLHLEIEDDGRGFDSAAIGIQAGPGERVGLTGMHERLALLGGVCTITSQPGHGTRVVADLPETSHLGGSANVQQGGPDSGNVAGHGPDR